MEADHLVSLPGGVELSFREVGAATGRPVLYLHGTPSSRMEAGGQLGEVAATLGLRILAPDRPGYGRTPFVRYDVRGYPEHIMSLLDVLEVGEIGIIGVSGGGRYACACGARLGSRVTRTALIASTAPSDLEGARVTWSKGDRQLYGLAVRAPWLLRFSLAVMARRIRSDPKRVPELFNDLPPEDDAVLARPEVQRLLTATMTETFHQGVRGAVHDIGLEARPWNIDLATIETPVDVWHGRKDTLVPVAQGQAVARVIPTANLRALPEEGHISLRVNRSDTILQAFA